MTQIINHRLAGTRITVWDIWHHLENQWSHDDIAQALNISVEKVQQAAEYIEQHRDELSTTWQQIEARNARGNSPDVEAKLTEAQRKRLAWVKERQGATAQEQHGVRNRA